MVTDALSKKFEDYKDQVDSECLVISQVHPKWIEEILNNYKGDQEVLQTITILSNHPDPALNISI